ncbi:hypothetical protein L210DRAFT_2030724 [Boletus edulis BED1]|uniref:Uncharacterized protein n=1 Tax=Boletus edulis BED1 TaxID=1328754 RepID=A0AAD4GLG2_BOLED|nr:hypothetical protein L210DRAFT_2030724 [Boletus edulis BED1]
MDLMAAKWASCCFWGISSSASMSSVHIWHTLVPHISELCSLAYPTHIRVNHNISRTHWTDALCRRYVEILTTPTRVHDYLCFLKIPVYTTGWQSSPVLGFGFYSYYVT